MMKYTILVFVLTATTLTFAQVEEDNVSEERQQSEESMPVEEQREATGEGGLEIEPPVEAPNFNSLIDSFYMAYQSLTIPEVHADYVQTLKQVEDPAVLNDYSQFIRKYKNQLKTTDTGTLDKRQYYDHYIMTHLLDQLGTFTNLRQQMINNGEEVIPGGLYNLYKGNLWYRYFFKYYNGGTFTDVNKLKAYAKTKIRTYQKEIEREMQQLGFENPNNLYAHLKIKSNYVNDREELLVEATKKADNVRMGAGNMFNISMPSLQVKISNGATRLDADAGVLYLKFPENGYPLRDLEYDIIKWVAGHYLLAQLETPPAKLAGLVNTMGFEAAWAMYVTKHGKRFQLYRTPINRLGTAMRNKYAAVVSRIDVGIHLDGWDEQQALRFWEDNLPWLDNGKEMIAKITRQPAYHSVAPWNSFQIENKRINAPLTMGSKIKPAAYYDMLLKHGVMPINIIFQRLEKAVKE